MAKPRGVFCGPKLSICCTLMSVWGIVMLGLLGILFYVRSAALLEDISLDDLKNTTGLSPEQENKLLTESFHASAVNCWGAAGLYVVIFVISIIQVFFNFKK